MTGQTTTNEGDLGCAHGYVSYSTQRSVFQDQREEQIYICDLCGRSETKPLGEGITMTFPRFAMVSIDGQNYIHRADSRGKLETKTTETSWCYAPTREIVPTKQEHWTNKAKVFRQASL